ncbi:galactose-binding like protein [Pilatotrama ljubarskyi]|nr:galactose-binding like protein [Pilatotrama ljubarskyi]
MAEWTSLIDADTKIKVSSTLDKSVGKKYLTDGSPETCWTSQQGTPQYIQLSFPSPVIPKRVELTFQGGFVGTRCTVEVLPTTEAGSEAKWRTLARVYPEDVNRKQIFELSPDEPELADCRIESMKLVFEESSDFFGRVTVYDLRVLGMVSSLHNC